MPADARPHDGLQSPGVRTGRIVAIAGGILLFLLMSFGLLMAFYRWQVPSYHAPPPREFPAPRVFGDHTGELNDLLAAQQQSLRSYRWMDRDAGIVAIPIERAMELIAQRGAAAYAPIVAATSPQQPAPSQPEAKP
jgi:hypothetical protein